MIARLQRLGHIPVANLDHDALVVGDLAGGTMDQADHLHRNDEDACADNTWGRLGGAAGDKMQEGAGAETAELENELREIRVN